MIECKAAVWSGHNGATRARRESERHPIRHGMMAITCTRFAALALSSSAVLGLGGCADQIVDDPLQRDVVQLRQDVNRLIVESRRAQSTAETSAQADRRTADS